MLKKLKMLLGITDSTSDELLSYLLRRTEGWVRRFCRLTGPLPEALEDMIVEMCDTRYRIGGYGSKEAPKEVSSVSDNGQSVSYKSFVSDEEKRAKNGLTDAEKEMLREWRRLF